MIFFYIFLTILIAGDQFLLASPQSGDTPATVSKAEDSNFVGVKSCQSSLCHGGAAPMSKQCTVWRGQDRHAHAYATLTTAYSARIAQTLGIEQAFASPRCTICHAPHGDEASPHPQQVSLALDGVSCEECHGDARTWLRSHTRPDYTYAQRVGAGLRDLRSAYVRAATCVACHQVIGPDLLKAGHPALTFELDSLTVAEPPHWQEKQDWFGPKAWLVGQAIALRDISRELAQGTSTTTLLEQEKALQWLFTQIPGMAAEKASNHDHRERAEWSNHLALDLSGQTWSQAKTQATLLSLASTSTSFRDPQVSNEDQSHRAERLLAGIDRLSSALPKHPGQEQINQLYAQLNNPADFKPDQFSAQLKTLEESLK